MVVTFGACGKEQAAEEVAEEAVAEVEAEVSEGATKEAKADTKDAKKDSKSDKKSDEKKDDKNKKDESDQSKKDAKNTEETKSDKESSDNEKSDKVTVNNVSEKASVHPVYWPDGVRCSGELPAGVWNKEHTYQIGCAPYGTAQRWDTSTYDERVDVDATTYRIYHHVVETNRESSCPYCGATIKYDDRDSWESYDVYQYDIDYTAYRAAYTEAQSHWDTYYYEYYNPHGGQEAWDVWYNAANENGQSDDELYNRYQVIADAAAAYADEHTYVNEEDYRTWQLVETVNK
jgi:hypothetical protein